MYPVLRKRNFALLWLGGLASSGGDWILALALPFHLYERTGSVLASGALFVANMLPRVLFGSVAGVFADRWDRCRTMLAADLARAALLLLLLPAAASDAWLWLSYPVVALEAAISQFFLPARGSFLPELVAPSELLQANSLNAVADSALRLLAPPLGGALFEQVGLPSVVLMDGATYLFSALMVASLRTPARPAGAEPQPTVAAAGSRWVEFWEEWLAGLRAVRRDRLLGTVFLVAGIGGIADGLLGPPLYVFIQEVLGAGADVLGWMVSPTGPGRSWRGSSSGRSRMPGGSPA